MKKKEHIYMSRGKDLVAMQPRCICGVISTDPRCFRDVSAMYPRCIRDVSAMYPRCFHGVSTVFPRCFRDAPRCLFFSHFHSTTFFGSQNTAEAILAVEQALRQGNSRNRKKVRTSFAFKAFQTLKLIYSSRPKLF